MFSRAGRIMLGLIAVAAVAGTPWALGRLPAVLFTDAAAAGDARAADDDTLGAIPAEAWLNAGDVEPSPATLRGSVVLMEFWTYLCYNCKNVEGWMKSSYARYRERGLVVLGVHTPEFEVERRIENVQRYLRENGIEWPVAIDNGYAVWRRYNATNAWPAFLVFDRSGRLVFRAAGEGAVHGAREAIERSLEAAAMRSDSPQRDDAVNVRASARRTAPDRAVLTLELAARAGIRLVRRPPNEVRIEPAPGVIAPNGPVLLGEAAEPSDASEVAYFDGPASLRIPLALAGPGPFELAGHVTYRYCEDAARICRRSERRFSAAIPDPTHSAPPARDD